MNAPFSRTFADLLFEQAERYDDAAAVISGDRVISYAELARRSGHIAAGLRDLGVRRGDRVGLLINNRFEWLEAFFGATILGAVVVAFSTWSKRDELDWQLHDADVRVLITLDRFGEQNFAADLHALIPEAGAGAPWRSAAFPPLQEIVLLGENEDIVFKSYCKLAGAEAIGRLPPGKGRAPWTMRSLFIHPGRAAGRNRCR